MFQCAYFTQDIKFKSEMENPTSLDKSFLPIQFYEIS